MKHFSLALCLFLLAACQVSPATSTAIPSPLATSTAIPSSPAVSTAIPSSPASDSVAEIPRAALNSDALLNGFSFEGPLDEAALTPPADAAPAAHVFEGRLELLGEKENGHIEFLRGELGADYASLPEFDFEFVQDNGWLIPVERGLVITAHPAWNIILEPGRVWQEAGDGDFSRASLPFALVVKGGNAAFNGTLTFLFDEQRVSKVWYQVTQETTSYTRANLWGLLDAGYQPGVVSGAEDIRADFAAELAARMPVKPIEALAQDYPGVNVSAFGSGVTPEHVTFYGVAVNGVNYTGGCRTRFGLYPYCESMRATSYSTAKSAFASVALMRLAQKFDADVAGLLIKDYVPEYSNSAGDWEQVTFNHALDMSTGNYESPGFMVDDESEKMGVFFGAQPYAARIQAAFSAPHRVEPGTRWVYRTSDTFIVTRAMHNYLQSRAGADADIYQFVVDEVYRPLGLGPGAFTTMRTADNDWQGQAEGGYGQWWTSDDIAKIGTFLLGGGKINGEQILQPALLAASLQQNPADRGVSIDSQRMYNNAFWANRYTQSNGYDCEFWVTQMLGVSGNVVALFPNGVTYYYFSDNQEFTWDTALRESDKVIPLCPEPSGGGSPTPVATPTGVSAPTSTPVVATQTMTPTPPPPSYPVETVTFVTNDGITLAGTLFGDGEMVVLLAHQGTEGSTQRTWHAFARSLAERGYAALAIDFRGVGKSEGQLGYSDLGLDVTAAAQFLQERGYKKIACVGASMGGTACIRAARDYPFAGLIILASTLRAGSGSDSLSLSSDELTALTPPKLFITADKDFSQVVNDTKIMHDRSPAPKELLLLPGTQHGTDLFKTDAGEELSAAMIGFLENIRTQAESLPSLQPIGVDNASGLQLLRTLDIPDYNKGQLSQCTVAFSPDNRLLAGACGKNRVPVWDVQSGALVLTLYDAPVQTVACAFSPDGQQIACGGFNKTVSLFDAATGERIARYTDHSAPVWDIAFHPDGKSLVSCSLGLLGDGGGRGDIRQWDALTGQAGWVYSGSRDYLSLAFHPAGAVAAYGSIGGGVGILDSTTGESLYELTDSHKNIGGVAYSPAGRWLAAGSDDNRIYVWATADYSLDAKLEGHKGYVNGVAFSPDETLLVSGSHDKTVGVWNLAGRKLLAQLKGHEREVLRVAFSPDGTLIASISWDGTVRLWGVSDQ